MLTQESQARWRFDPIPSRFRSRSATTRKHLDHLGVAIHTASGRVGKFDGALRALTSEMFIENLVLHTRRGLKGVISDGRHAGGRAVGYRAVLGKPTIKRRTDFSCQPRA